VIRVRSPSVQQATSRYYALVIATLIILAACSPAPPSTSGATLSPEPISNSTTDQTASPLKSTLPALTSPPVSTPITIPPVAAEPTKTGSPQCLPPEERAHVLDVRDGDTIQVQLDTGVIETVRYIGIDAPEQGDALYELSAEANKSLILDRDVCIWKDVSERDRYDRLLRFVRIDVIFVNLWLVEHGFASAWAYSPDTSMASVFEESQQKAIAAGTGMWGLITPTPAPPPPTPGGVVAPGTCDPSYPTVCIPSPPPDLDCGDISFRRFVVKSPDPHRFDRDGDGIGCEGN
jgi:micrococcal nuclease